MMFLLAYSLEFLPANTTEITITGVGFESDSVNSITRAPANIASLFDHATFRMRPA